MPLMCVLWAESVCCSHRTDADPIFGDSGMVGASK